MRASTTALTDSGSDGAAARAAGAVDAMFDLQSLVDQFCFAFEYFSVRKQRDSTLVLYIVL